MRTAAALAALAVALTCGSAAQAAAPSNDDFANAQPITGAVGSLDASNVDATKEPGEPIHAGYAGDASIWFSWTAPESRAYEFDTCGSSIPTTLAVYTGTSVDALTRHAGSGWDACGRNSYLAFDAVGGTTYRVAVDGAGLPSAQGAVALNWATAQPPGNDAFARPRVLTGPDGWFQGQTNGAAGKEVDEPDHAGDPGGASVWFTWTAPWTRLVKFETVTAYDSLLAVYTGGSLGDLASVAASDDWDGGPGSKVAFETEAGETYRIAVDGFGGAMGVFTLAWSSIARPENDDFANASSVLRGTNLAATSELGEPAHGGFSAEASIWFRWQAAYAGPATISTCATRFDTVLAVYTGADVAHLSPVASNDDACGNASSVRFKAVQGTTYYIAVDVARGEGGFVELAATLGPANDDFADAETLSGTSGNRSGATYFATHEADEPFHAGEPGTGSAWYRWTAPSDLRASFDVCNASGDTLLAVYTGTSLGALTQTVANDDSCGPRSRVEFDAAAGVTYAIAVDGFEDAISFVLYWSTGPLSPRNITPPTISGNAVENGVLTATTGTWVHASSYSYTWYTCTPGPLAVRSCHLVPNASDSQFTVPAGTIGKQIRVNVNAAGPYGNQGIYSEPTPVVGYGPPVNLRRPVVDGEAVVGATLVSFEGEWDFGSAPRQGVTFLWQRCNSDGEACQPVKGPSLDTSYVLSEPDRGSTIVVVVTVTSAGGSTSTASQPTFVVTRPDRIATRRACRVPRLIGRGLGRARAILGRAHCKLGQVRRIKSARKLGVIVAQRPKPGTRLRAGGRVNVVVSLGRRR